MTKTALATPSPMMVQWHDCKVKAGEALLLFRLGDFYEAFYEDAEILAKELDLTLTKRQEIPMSGVPAHTAEAYIEKLVAAGYLVAVADQIEDPKQVKGIVKRAVTRIVSPATHISSSLKVEKANNFIASIHQINSIFGISFLDLSTGECFAMELETAPKAFDELYRQGPLEILTSESFASKHKIILEDLKRTRSLRINIQPNWMFEHKACYNRLTEHFQTHSLDAFGLHGMSSAINACGALFAYLVDNLSQDLNHVKTLTPKYVGNYMLIDRTTHLHLDILYSQRGDKNSTLLSLLDRTKTPMGGRLLRSWLAYPLIEQKAIVIRQEAIEELIQKELDLPQKLKAIRDIERLAMKVHMGYAGPRDLLALGNSLSLIPELKACLAKVESLKLKALEQKLLPLQDLAKEIQNCIQENPPLKITEAGIFRSGIYPELDELRTLKSNSQDWLASYQVEMREKLDIKTLKVNFNNTFGYYIEVSKAQSHKMPDSFMRKQTLVNAERYISPSLKEYEHKILTAEEKMQRIEYEAFLKLREKTCSFVKEIQQNAKAIGEIDALISLAEIAEEKNYVRPLIDTSNRIDIQGGRHPIVEVSVQSESFVPNDTHLDHENQRLLVITGPNMAGKSTYIRQVAMIVIMAQIGSFVPAQSAHIGIVDKVFSRIGASDDLSRGQSTFMVEMTETANILNNATKKSLVILDEIGRGTSTYDGIAIASSVAEHLHTEIQAKTLFATHYWELTKLADQLEGAKNFRVVVEELTDSIAFLHRIEPGGADRSYGVQVAELSGIPSSVIAKAKAKLKELEKRPIEEKKLPPPSRKSEQLLLFPTDTNESSILDALRKIIPEEITPLEALKLIAKWKKRL